MSIKPDWNEISLGIDENLNHYDLNSAWTKVCGNWLDAIAAKFGNNYRVAESSNFSIMSNENDRYVALFSSFLERTLKRILTTLKGIASDEGFGLSSGMYINDGYGHFVFPSQELEYAESTAVHELTHACLDHLPIPLWLNEGLLYLWKKSLREMISILISKLSISIMHIGRQKQFKNFGLVRAFTLSMKVRSSVITLLIF